LGDKDDKNISKNQDGIKFMEKIAGRKTCKGFNQTLNSHYGKDTEENESKSFFGGNKTVEISRTHSLLRRSPLYQIIIAEEGENQQSPKTVGEDMQNCLLVVGKGDRFWEIGKFLEGIT